MKKRLINKKMNFIDLFCGAGGLSYGLEKAGLNCLLGIDHNKDSIVTFNTNHKGKGIVADITKIKKKDILKFIGNENIDLIVGGPPCQGFSMAGKRKPNDPRNSLFKEFLRIVNSIKPNICIMENVRGLLSMKTPSRNKVIDLIIKEFEKLDYNVEINSVNTANYGVPQSRYRIFLMAKKKNIEVSFPKETHNKENWKNLLKIILFKKEVPKNYFYSKKLIAGFKRREKKNRERGMGFGWKFLDFKKPSYTISARYWKDGAEALVKYRENDIRMLTPEECARIQSFPKSFFAPHLEFVKAQ